MRFDRPKPLTMAQQFLNLRSNPISAGGGRLRGNTLSWGFSVSPTLLSRIYSARIEYRQGLSPQVFIDVPDLLMISGGRRLPHVYEQSPVRLCLFHPDFGEFGSWMRLDQTIVPWTATWLLYFEEWLTSNEWAGGGLHPRLHDQGQRRSYSRSLSSRVAG
jgi:hypothetical protein